MKVTKQVYETALMGIKLELHGRKLDKYVLKNTGVKLSTGTLSYIRQSQSYEDYKRLCNPGKSNKKSIETNALEIDIKELQFLQDAHQFSHKQEQEVEEVGIKQQLESIIKQLQQVSRKL